MNGIVYAIKDLSTEEIIYVGSTTNLYMRKAAHKCDCFTKEKDLLVYNYIREKTDRNHFDEDFAFEELYSGEFETREELCKKEEEFIKDRAPRCNKYKAFLTEDERQEYFKTKKWREYNREYMREWRRRKNLPKNRKLYIKV